MTIANALEDRTNWQQNNQQHDQSFMSPHKRDHSQQHSTPQSSDLSDDELCRSLCDSLEIEASSPESDRLPAPFVSINPALLADERWQYRDLQKLCMSLGLGGRGNRSALVDKLRRWNRTEFDQTKQSAHPDEVSLPSNFTLLDLGISVRKSNENNPELTPLTSRPPRNEDGTPKSILSTPRRSREQEGKRRLSFSKFNGVCLIPSRNQQRFDVEPDVPQPNTACHSSPPRVPMPRVGGR